MLLGLNAFILLIPLLAILLLDIYQGYLVRQTERRLISESVLIGEAWRELQLREGERPDIRPKGSQSPFFFIEPVVDLSEGICPPEGEIPSCSIDEQAPERRAGRQLKPLLDRAKLINLSAARILDSRGCVVSSTGSQLGVDLSKLPEVAEALKGRYHAVARSRYSDEPPPPLTSVSRRGTIRVFTATPILSDGQLLGVVRMSRTALSPLEALWEYHHLLLFAFISTLFLTVAGSLHFARSIIRPVREITAAAQSIARGEERLPLQPHGLVPRELYDLSQALDLMMAQLQERANYIAEFAANLSHELKTPITAVRGAVELLREMEMSSAQQDHFLSNINEDAARMERLVNRLLRLARIEHGEPPQMEVPLMPLLEPLVEPHKEQLLLKISAEVPNALRVHPEQLSDALRNLLENALRHGKGEPVELSVQREGSKIHFSVRDQGEGISEGNQARIFERFFTTQRDQGGTGLGLAIVCAVARRHQGRAYFESSSKGSIFHLVIEATPAKINP